MLAPTVRSLNDQRHRAPFAHTSSSADLTSPELSTSLRSFPLQPSAFIQDKTTPISRVRSPAPNPFRPPSLTVPDFETIRFVALCSLWYASSALSSNTGKVILNHFRFPVTLTIVQFFFVALYCIICSRAGWTRLRDPTKAILRGVLPMAAFQVGGHIFGSLAISRVPVSTVHTIKALSPLFTVLAYALLFGVSYSPATYISLLPLTIGVMLACSFDMTISNIFGLICAFGSTLIFVSQNIFFKKIMPTNSETIGLGAKLDKLNLLYFSSSMAFVLMIPVWLYSDVARLWSRPMSGEGPSITFYFFVNGTVHFGQNLLAFAILSSTSPVTYSIASLVKRIAVICLAIVWFKQSVHPIQAIGIASTAVGLLMYNNAKRDVEKGEKRLRQVEATRDGLLPTNKVEAKVFSPNSSYDMKAHSSPKPSFQDFQLSSTSSALRAATFSAKQSAPIETVYPSPPPSTSSSPPTEVAVGQPIRNRRLSEVHKDTVLRLPTQTAGALNESQRGLVT